MKGSIYRRKDRGTYVVQWHHAEHKRSYKITRYYGELMPTARKHHVCCECESIIDPGEKYWRIDGLWDKFETFKMCDICHQIAEHAYRGGHDCIPFGCLYEIVGGDYEDAVVL